MTDPTTTMSPAVAKAMDRFWKRLEQFDQWVKDATMTDHTALPSRERARELADSEGLAARTESMRSSRFTHEGRIAIHNHRWHADTAAILAAYAEGKLVSAEEVEGRVQRTLAEAANLMRNEVEGMRERAAAICDDEVGVKPSPYYETSRTQEALEAAAAAIRALPLTDEPPHEPQPT